MVKLHINEQNLKNARTSETFPGTSPIFAISSNDGDSTKAKDSSNKDVPSSTTRRWTQVCGFFKITNYMCESFTIQAHFTFIITYRSVFQVISLLPVYLLQISYGMNTGYPAIITPQLEEPCSEFNITADQESWIGMYLFTK